MKKPTLNFFVDSLAFFLFLCLLSTGILIFLIMPPASGYSVWGMDRHVWGEIHFWIAITFLIVMALHVTLHWKWIITKVKGNTRDARHSKRRILIAILLVLIFLLLLLAPFLSPVEKSSDGQGRQGIHAQVVITPHV